MRLVRRLILGSLLVLICTGSFALFHPRSPLPAAWNPMKPLSVTDELTPFTNYKMRRALGDPEACFAALGTGAEFLRMTDFQITPVCHIRDRVELRAVAGLTLKSVETRCQTALRLALWAQHGIKPAARLHLGTDLSGLIHNSSYNCRQIRAPGGSGGRMSTHATAEAIDIAGVVLEGGGRIPLLGNWNTEDSKQDFFFDLRDTACRWFRVTLGPDYNSLHADHFHLQHTGWGLCR